MTNGNAHIIFSCRDTEWSKLQVQKRQTHAHLLDIVKEHCLTQIVNVPSGHETLRQSRINVDATSCIDVDATLYKCHVLAG